MTSPLHAAPHAARDSGRRKPLRVAIASPLGKGGAGGMDRLSDLIIAHLEGDGASLDVTVTRLTTRGPLRHTAKGPQGRPYSAFLIVLAALKLISLGLLGRIHLLHVHLAAGGSWLRKYVLFSIARLLGIPVVVHIHSGRFADYWSTASPFAARSITRLLSGSARIITLSQAYRKTIVERLPEVRDRVLVLANATPARRPVAAQSDDPRVTITFLGVLARLKGVDDLIAALGRMHTPTAWQAVLAGHGDIDGYRKQAEEAGVADRVEFPGWLDEHGVDALLARTSVFVLPSYSEGLPMSILEAFAAGLPVVATPLPAIVDVVHEGRNGCLVTAGDVAGLSNVLARLVEDAALRRRLGQAAFADHAAHYAIEPYVERLVSVWRSACDGRSRPHELSPASSS